MLKGGMLLNHSITDDVLPQMFIFVLANIELFNLSWICLLISPILLLVAGFIYLTAWVVVKIRFMVFWNDVGFFLNCAQYTIFHH